MRENLVSVLNCRVNIEELRQYYNTVVQEHQNLKWDFSVGGDYITDEWRQRMMAEPSTLLPYGWAIQSNITNLNEPCPPYNITSHERVDYRNTVLSFGIIERLQKAIPYAYRWSISVQPPNGKVSTHSDQEDEYTIWIPIYSDVSDGITFVVNDKNYRMVLPSTGHLYLLDTTVPHFTVNNGDSDRVAIIFRINQKHTIKLINTTGLI